MAETITTPYKPCLNYERYFDLDKGENSRITFNYTKSYKNTKDGNSDIKIVLTKKETI